MCVRAVSTYGNCRYLLQFEHFRCQDVIANTFHNDWLQRAAKWNERWGRTSGYGAEAGGWRGLWERMKRRSPRNTQQQKNHFSAKQLTTNISCVCVYVRALCSCCIRVSPEQTIYLNWTKQTKTHIENAFVLFLSYCWIEHCINTSLINQQRERAWKRAKCESEWETAMAEKSSRKYTQTQTNRKNGELSK